MPDRCDFRIMPRYKYRNEGDRVVYGDYFILQNVKTNFYLHIENTPLSKQEIPIQRPDYRPKVAFRRPMPGRLYTRYPVDAKVKKNRWQALPFHHAHDDQRTSNSFLKGGDIVRIRHTELNGYITADGDTKSDERYDRCFVRVYTGPQDLERISSNSQFEVECNTNTNRGRFFKWRGWDDEDDSEDDKIETMDTIV